MASLVSLLSGHFMKSLNILFGIIILLIFNIASANTMTLDVDVNQSEFELHLPANPTTGYTWKVLSFDKTLLALEKEVFVSDEKTHKVGAGGTRIYIFKLIKRNMLPASTNILLRYGRSWDDTSKQDTTVIVQFTNRPKSPDMPATATDNPNVILPQSNMK
tara:strand:+ start:627 stop:1109 length:483 start_codon:yes stop_codon:yes gene_type:complete